ncbi:hypothetical protein JTB14_021798 [Gonioctena quinquepunctata]|nr:hypothetical protein JTB14_021798 [Gonioctena quinquepunctata]
MNCMVLWFNNKGKIPRINYFCLTKKRHDAWMQALGRNPIAEHLSEKNVICSKHFYPEDIYRGGNRIQLRSNAVPKLYLRKKYNIIQQGSSRVLQEMLHNRITSKESPQKVWMIWKYFLLIIRKILLDTIFLALQKGETL